MGSSAPSRPRRQPLWVPAGRAGSLATRRAPRQPAPGCPPAPPSRRPTTRRSRRRAAPLPAPQGSPLAPLRRGPGRSSTLPRAVAALGAGHRRAAGLGWGWGTARPSRLRISAARGSHHPDARGSARCQCRFSRRGARRGGCPRRATRRAVGEPTLQAAALPVVAPAAVGQGPVAADSLHRRFPALLRAPRRRQRLRWALRSLAARRAGARAEDCTIRPPGG